VGITNEAYFLSSPLWTAAGRPYATTVPAGTQTLQVLVASAVAETVSWNAQYPCALSAVVFGA
jgi:hypothetical protein